MLTQLVSAVELDSVRYAKLCAERQSVENPSQGIDVQMASQRTEDEEEGRTRLHYRLTTKVEHEDGTIEVVAVATYSVPPETAATLDERLLLMFGNDVALFTLIPYARQAISNLALQVLYTEVNIPILKQGDIIFESSEDARDTPPESWSAAQTAPNRPPPRGRRQTPPHPGRHQGR